MANFSFEATGTHWVVTLPQSARTVEIVEKIKKRVAEFESVYSRFITDSLVTKISTQIGTHELPDDAKVLFDTYLKFAKLTDELFTPLIGQNLVELGYDKDYTFVQRQLTDIPKISDVFEYKFPYIKIKVASQFDFGAAGKGYLIDLLGELVQSNLGSNSDFIVDGGQDILCKGIKEIKVGLEHPKDATKVIGVANIKNQVICGSSGNRRSWGKFSHIVNPRLKQSPQNILGVWAVSDTAIVADALSTCLFFVNPASLYNDYKFEYLIVFDDYTYVKSEKFPGEVFNA